MRHPRDNVDVVVVEDEAADRGHLVEGFPGYLLPQSEGHDSIQKNGYQNKKDQTEFLQSKICKITQNKYLRVQRKILYQTKANAPRSKRCSVG